MSKNILLVEDDVRMREIINDYFSIEGFQIFETDNGREALEIFEGHKFNLVLLDIMIPEIDGWSVCKRIRKSSDVPIILITARSDEDDKLLGYDLGADDYITKPFSPRVLLAKAKMLLKRAEGSVGADDSIIAYNGIEINRLSRTVVSDGKILELALKEYELLLFLVENKNIVLSREKILRKIWGYEYFGDDRTVDTHIKKLRSKLGNKACYIVTVIGCGYKFEVM